MKFRNRSKMKMPKNLVILKKKKSQISLGIQQSRLKALCSGLYLKHPKENTVRWMGPNISKDALSFWKGFSNEAERMKCETFPVCFSCTTFHLWRFSNCTYFWLWYNAAAVAWQVHSASHWAVWGSISHFVLCALVETSSSRPGSKVKDGGSKNDKSVDAAMRPPAFLSWSDILMVLSRLPPDHD